MARSPKPSMVPIEDVPLTGVALPDDLARIQAEHAQPDAPVVKLGYPKGTPTDVDPGPPRPQKAADAPTPRFVHQNERAPKGLKRFKMRCTNMGSQPMRYVLARDEQAAKEYYVEATGLGGVLDAMNTSHGVAKFMLRELPD